MYRTRSLGEPELIDRLPCIMGLMLGSQLFLYSSKYLLLATICSMELAQFCCELLSFLLYNPLFMSCTSPVKVLLHQIHSTFSQKEIKFWSEYCLHSKDITSCDSKYSGFKKTVKLILWILIKALICLMVTLTSDNLLISGLSRL